MKITIAPSFTQDHYAGDPRMMQQTVVIEVPSDDIGLDQAVELMGRALKAYGFPAEAVDQWIEPQ